MKINSTVYKIGDCLVNKHTKEVFEITSIYNSCNSLYAKKLAKPYYFGMVLKFDDVEKDYVLTKMARLLYINNLKGVNK